jgi:glycosyltransferase involved in cell wall biosynthesis
MENQKLGLNLVGYYNGDLGLGEALRYIAKALIETSIPFLVRQFKVRLLSSQSNQTLNSLLASECKYPINCIVINPDLIYSLPKWINFSEWAHRYNIGYWFWELENFPHAWRYSIPLINEIWVNTEFVANAMRQAHTRVTKIPFAVEFETPSIQYTRQYFGLPDSGFLFLCTFDFQSSVARKNPKASIEAFLEAFPLRADGALLIVKTINAHLHPQQFDQLKQDAQNDPRILFLDQQLSSTEMRGLLQCADCYVSLHRSEGLGLGMAESMFLGKPVIATAYSGNLEFMNNENACLIPYKKIAVGKDEYPHAKHQVWADPKIHDAASAMQKIFNDAEYRSNLGENARKYMLENHSLAVMGAAIKKRLEEIKDLLS